MNYITFLILMLFCHYLGDYPMQGILASMKQKSWWEKQIGYDERYHSRDYIPALLIHSFVWAFMIMLPILVRQGFNMNIVLFIVFVGNIGIHMIVNDLKANYHVINLIEDQLIHLVQILVTSLLYFAYL